MACLSVPAGLQNPVGYDKLQSGAKVEGKDCGNRERADVTGDHGLPRDGRGCHTQEKQRDNLGLTLCGCWAGHPRQLGEERQLYLDLI